MSTNENNPFLRLAAWIAEVLGLVIEFTDGRFITGVNEQDVAAQLHYGRD